MYEPLTIAKCNTLPTQELYEIVWDMYKDIEGIRPRWMDPHDRDGFLSYLEYELRPEVIAGRELDRINDQIRLEELERFIAIEEAEYSAMVEEENAWLQTYDHQYAHIDMVGHRRTLKIEARA